MEEKILSCIIIGILVLILIVCESICDNIIYFRKNIENKINENCIYINEEIYCKD